MTAPALRLARAHWTPLAGIALLAFVAALLAVLVPARTADAYDRAAADAVAGTDVQVRGKAGGAAAFGRISSGEAMASAAVGWRSLLPPSLARVTGDPEPSIATADLNAIGRFKQPRMLTLNFAPDASRRIRIVAGAPSLPWGAARPGEIGVLIPKTYADLLGYRPGDRIELFERKEPGTIRTRVAGVYAPLNAADPYWAPHPSMLQPQKVTIDSEGTKAELGTALMDGDGYSTITRTSTRQLNFTWRFPVRADEVDARNADSVAAALDAYRSAVSGRADIFPCTVSTVLDTRLDGYLGRLHAAQSVLALAFGGLAGVAAGVLLLAAGLFGERLRPALGLMRARGAAARQLAPLGGGLTAAAVVPSAALGYLAGRLLDAGPPQPSSAYAVGALAVAVLAVAAVGAVLGARRASTGADRRDDVAAARPSRRRRVVEVLLIALAATGVVLLRRRGAGAGADPLVAAVPVLLGAAAGVLVLRGYPYLLRAAGPALRRRRGPVAFLGLARAGRQNPVGALPLAVLLLAAAVAGFAATVNAELRAGQARASWARTGADARVAAGPLDDATLRRIRAVPGVTGVVTARVIENVSIATDPAPMTVIGVDLGVYRKLAPGVPDVPRSGVVMSPLAAQTIRSGSVVLSRPGLDPLRVTPSGTVDRFPGQDAGTAFVIVPYRLVAEEHGFPREVFVAGERIDAEALRAAVPGRDVRMRQDDLRALTTGPMVGVVHGTFRDGALIAGAFGLLAVLLVLVAGAQARGRVTATLRMLGLSGRQSRVLALVEIAPVLLCAVGAGWVLGLLLPQITGPAVDLRPYTGGHSVIAYVPDTPALLGLAGALLLAAAATVAVDRAFDADPGTVLRTGT
ncbi:FtsX-like permease family protein [Actinomadura syzygii]|uniref:ABC3 transporter permease C-terminal domain-containing protein n=1 Tax=Actinomadura syzygii TaxID=1427538 RepID=A0A5D0U5L7_9ACTN|nr:FtsX-like permease family protein [Actinomadura syzygii]TYC13025.1 hypothetical protein FXF65_21165 [Actinomadura syzygii]